MSFTFTYKKQILFLSGISLILLIFDILYVINLPLNASDNMDVIKILIMIRIIFIFIEFLSSVNILIYRNICNILEDLIYLQLEIFLNNLGYIFSIIILVLQWGINLYNTSITILLMKAKTNKKEKYNNTFQIVWILVLGNIACIAWVIVTFDWFYKKKTIEYVFNNKKGHKKNDTKNGKIISLFIDDKNTVKYLINVKNEVSKDVIIMKNFNFIRYQSSH